ncbi:hypothetical protein [Kordia sp.]|uniref:hypothetical protein n=1 Tax=Kordia sp. TaxID=1965332 RepID=UPI003D6BD453
MKKIKFQKLTLHKNVISNLEQPKAGQANPIEISKRPLPGVCTVIESCARPRSCGPEVCLTEQGYGLGCSWVICTP